MNDIKKKFMHFNFIRKNPFKTKQTQKNKKWGIFCQKASQAFMKEIPLKMSEQKQVKF